MQITISCDILGVFRIALHTKYSSKQKYADDKFRSLVNLMSNACDKIVFIFSGKDCNMIYISFSGKQYLNEYIKHYEGINYNTATLHDSHIRAKRSVDSHVNLQFFALGRYVVMTHVSIT